jgi:Zn-finger nucleic acid-binding protein
MRASDDMLTCPRCLGRLTPALRERTAIARCRRCRGVWLDAGELDRLLARAWAAADDDAAASSASVLP